MQSRAQVVREVERWSDCLTSTVKQNYKEKEYLLQRTWWLLGTNAANDSNQTDQFRG